jgi:hypothetical protein
LVLVRATSHAGSRMNSLHPMRWFLGLHGWESDRHYRYLKQTSQSLADREQQIRRDRSPILDSSMLSTEAVEVRLCGHVSLFPRKIPLTRRCKPQYSALSNRVFEAYRILYLPYQLSHLHTPRVLRVLICIIGDNSIEALVSRG